MLLPTLFQTFVRERKLLHNVTEKTLRWYDYSWRAFSKHLPADLDSQQLTEAHLKAATMALASSGGPSAITVNCYIRSMNALLNWAHQDGHTETRLRIRKLKVLLPSSVATLLQAFAHS